MPEQSTSEFVDQLQSQARYTFTRAEIESALNLSQPALTKALQRLNRAGRIRMIRRGFFAIVPLEYLASGMIPPDWFVDDLMRFLQQPYYVGLLTAAALHGAGHQQPQEYQIVVARPERTIRLPRVRIRFFVKKSATNTPTVRIKAYTGHLPVSTPAGTALDLARFASTIGGLDAVLTVLDELMGKVSPEDLLSAARHETGRSHVQRLGWLIERTRHPEKAASLAEWLAAQNPTKVPLDVGAPTKGSRKDPRWQVIVNAEPESES